MVFDFGFELEQLDLMRCISLLDSGYDESQASLRESLRKTSRRLSLHAFEHTPLSSNVEEEFGNGKSNMADLSCSLSLSHVQL